MKIIILILSAVVFVECGHTFMGTNVLRPLVQHHKAKFSSYIFRKRVEYYNYTLPRIYIVNGESIKGILAYDLTDSSASANITQGGIGYNYFNLRMKSERGKKLYYDIYVYV
ncbi:uncharacterized protein LOC116412677 [Galleria mellonella]|uniref:Uncharacterized protein LOC116412677 n=1 Tax=Galleria mellonella TaxID=7137 RepID=A0ABM3N4D5_GALME|nr:uncharacterized protein LOC116412677 [Galleria mellonella]